MTHTVPGYFIYPQHPLTVCVIGVGGTGSAMLTKLVQINQSLIALGKAGIMVTAYDNDKVSSANIGRQNFVQADVGMNKAEVLISRINRNFGFGWEGMPVRYKHQHNECGYNIAITCVDNVESRKDFWKPYMAKQYTPIPKDGWIGQEKACYWLDIGNGKDFGQVILGTLAHIDQPEGVQDSEAMLQTVCQIFPNLEDHEQPDQPSCSAAEAIGKQDLMVNQMMATWGAAMLWDLLHKARIDKHGVYVNLKNYSVNPLMIKQWRGKIDSQNGLNDSGSKESSRTNKRLKRATLNDLMEGMV